MSLTSKQAAFVAAYLVDSNGKKAAIKAGYSASGAEVAASRLLRHPKVAAALKKAKADAAATAKSARPEPPAPKFNLATALQHKDPRAFLLAAMNDVDLEPKLRVDAAKALMPFEFAKKGEAGKKEQAQENAKKVASRFAPAAPPKLVAAGGKKV
jgi:phage terminase small subunit